MSFAQWLSCQTQRNDIVGMFACDSEMLDTKPHNRKSSWVKFLKSMNADKWAFEALDKAFDEFTIFSKRFVVM